MQAAGDGDIDGHPGLALLRLAGEQGHAFGEQPRNDITDRRECFGFEILGAISVFPPVERRRTIVAWRPAPGSQFLEELFAHPIHQAASSSLRISRSTMRSRICLSSGSGSGGRQ